MSKNSLTSSVHRCLPTLPFTLIGIPFGFYAWWICLQYVAHTEVMGHSGLRVYFTPPLTCSWPLRIWGAELTVEDHDLHHRRGWRKAYNYGKQTRIWDRLFGTCDERVKTASTNIAFDRLTRWHCLCFDVLRHRIFPSAHMV